MATLAASGSLTAAWNGTGVAPAGSVVQLTTADATSVGVEITGTFVATILLEATMDGALWFALNPFSILGVGVSATFTAPGRCVASVADFVQCRARCSAYTSGAAVVTMDGSAAASAGGGSGGGGGGAVTVADGANVALGATTDVAVQGDNPGTLSAKLRGLNKTLVTGIPITSLPALSTGANVIGAVTQSGTWNVTVNTALPAGANSIGTVVLGAGSAAVGTVALTAGAAVVGAVTQSGTWNVTVNTALPAGSNSIGTVVLGAGAAAVGTVGVTSLPAIPTGSNVIGAVTQSGTWNVTVNTALPAGSNSIGTVVQGAAGAAGWLVVGPQASGAAVATNPVLVAGMDGTNLRYMLTDTSGRSQVVGAAASGTALAGNPVLLGISDATNAQNWKQQAASSSAVAPTGIPMVVNQLFNSGNVFGPQQNANLQADSSSGSLMGAVSSAQWNGASWDRPRPNVDVTLLASSSKSVTQGPTTLTTYNLGAIIFVLDMTIVGTGSVTLTINEVDPASGKSILLLSGAAVITNTTNVYMIDPMLTAAANSIAKNRTTRTLSWTVTANNGNGATYSLGAMELVS